MKTLDKCKQIVSSFTERFRFTIKLGYLFLFFISLLLFSSTASAVPLEVDSIVQLTNGSGYKVSPVWSPDGTEIIYSRDNAIYKMALADQIEVELDVPGGKWSPDGNQVLFLNGSLWIINKDGSSERQIPNTDDAGRNFAWSPDGLKIAYTNSTELIIIEPDGSNKHVIYAQPGYTGDGGAWSIGLYNMAWSPDSSKIVIEESIGEEGEIFLKVLNTDGTNPKILSPSLLTGGKGISSLTQSWQSQVWSPDGSKIVYEVYDMREGYGAFICMSDSNGTSSHILEGEFSEDASFSPDGSKIVYSYVDINIGYGPSRDIWIMDADGTNKTQLTTTSVRSYNPVWSPDGTKIAFKSDVEGNYDIWIINLKEDDGIITVDDDGSADYTTIQAAVDAANDGDTIQVSAGNYSKTIEVNKSISIISVDGPNATKITGYEVNIFNVSADNVVISGFTVGHSLTAIYSVSDHNTFTNNIFISNMEGMLLEHSNNNLIENNKFRRNYGGNLGLIESNYNVIDNNDLDCGYGSGILVRSSIHNTITNNSVYDYFMSGIDIGGSDKNKIIGNNIYFDYFYGDVDGHGVGGLYGMSITQSDENIIHSNRINNTTIIMYCADAVDNLIYNNYFYYTGWAIYMGSDNLVNTWNITRSSGTNIIGGSYLGGNYWATPDGTGFSQIVVDYDGDGIGEYSYELDATNIDYLPLTTNEANPGDPRTLMVDDSGGAYYASIQAAVDAANDGDTILVSPGTYIENVDVGKQVSIVSTEGAEATNIVAASDVDHVFEVTADGVIISGFSVEGAIGDSKDSIAGIYLSSDGNKLTDNIMQNNTHGIYLFSSNSNEMTNNLVLRGTYGIYMSYSNDNKITENTVSNEPYMPYGIRMEYSNNNTLTGNDLPYILEGCIVLKSSNNNLLVGNSGESDSDYGIRLIDSNNNTLTSNKATWRSGIGLSFSNYNTLNNNTASGDYDGISLDSSNYNTLTNNTGISFSEPGISLHSSSHNTLINNTAASRIYAGIYLINSEENKLVSNTINKGEEGIRLTSSSHNTLTGNNVSNLTGYGIILSSLGIHNQELNLSSDNTLTENNLEENSVGIFIDNSTNNILSGNILWENEYGISLSGSSDNTIVDNEIKNYAYDTDQSSEYGIFVTYSEGNTLDNNVVLNNVCGIYLLSSGSNILSRNQVLNNEYESFGIYLNSSNYNRLENNNAGKVYSNGAIYLYNSDYNDLTNNGASVEDSNAEIELYSSNNNTLTGNSASTYIGGNYNILTDSRVSYRSGFGIGVNGSNNILLNNNISNNLDYGIEIRGSNNKLIGNTLSKNACYGIYVAGSGHTLLDNIISNNEINGIYLMGTDHNLTGNSISGNGYGTYGSLRGISGLYAASSSNCLFYNNLFNNTLNVVFDGTNSGNQWNISRTSGSNIIGGSYLGGNYWATPNGTGFSQTAVDTDGDSICESSYELDANNIDYLPLTTNEAPNQHPTANIVSISPNPVTKGNTVFFSGSGNDTDGTIAAYNWTSSIDGNLGYSASFSTSSLSAGNHTILFCVQDNDGEWSADVSSSLVINEAPVQNGNDSAPVLVSVNPTSGSTLAAGTSSVNINFNYSDNETGIDTGSVVLVFKYVDVTADSNTTITNTSAQYNATGLEAGTYNASVYVVDNSGNSATFNTSFTIAKASSSSSGSSSKSSSSSGGGGGGSSGESYANIAVKEAESIFITKDAHVNYEFNDDDNAISSVQFDSLKNSGRIQAIVEVLKDRSSFAQKDAPGEVYQQMNIWVGKSGFVTSDNVENLLITFRVDKSWLTENNVESGNVLLYRYSNGAWNSLPTTVSEEDNEYVYFECETPGFSPFAISAESESGAAEEDTLQSVADETTGTAEENPVSETEPDSSGVSTTAILVMLGLFAVVLVGGYVLYGKRS